MKIFLKNVDLALTRASTIQERLGADPFLSFLIGVDMQYMMIHMEPASEFAKRNDPAQAPAYWNAWMSYVGQMNQSGIVVTGNGLMPPEMGTSLRIRDGKRHIQDGPYPDTKEHLAGYFVVEAPSLDVVLQWAEKCPAATAGRVDIVPVMPPPPKS